MIGKQPIFGDSISHRMHETTHDLSCSRRDFLRSATGMALGGIRPFLYAGPEKKRKVIVVTFGGGARDQETFAPLGQENIPHLLKELIPQASFFTQVVNRGILGHYVATASLATGVYETLNNFASVPPQHPTVFEYFRKNLRRPPTDAWVVAPSNGFSRIGESESRLYGPSWGAQVILPKHLLLAAMSGEAVDYEHLLRDNYETPLFAPQLKGNEFESRQIETMLRLSVADFKTRAKTLASPDELSIYVVQQLMQQQAPSLIWVTMHDIDVAHTGAYSLYVESIRRTDRLCAELWKTVQSHPEYAGNTTMLILPDFGRDSDEEAGGNGFQHHRTGDPSSRTTWMIALGAGVRQGMIYDHLIQSTDLVPTLGSIMGFQASIAQGRPIQELF